METKRTGVHARADLMRLLHPQSIAVVGASTRPGSFGERVLFNMQFYSGRHYPVNARYEKIGDAVCYPTVADLPEVPDCAVITAPREAVEEIVLDCARAGVGGAIVFASGYAETGKEDRAAQQARLAAIARETGLRIVGPNCIGVVNALLDSRITFMNITPIPQPNANAVGIISQSGALGMALAQSVVRGASVSHVLTSGNSCDVDMADYVNFLAEDPACKSIACVFEGMATPERLLLAAENAWKHDKPLVIFKMATGEQGARAAMSHTGSLAGSQAAYRAVFRKAGAVLVDDFEALMETASFFAKAPPPKARGAAVVAASGGAAIMAADRAEQHGVAMPQPSAPTRAVLESRIPEFGSARNPCDVTAQVLSDPDSLGACAGALLEDPQYGVLVSPMTYGYEPSAKRCFVYDELAKTHGKVACIAWQTEWLEGPGVREAESCERVALFHSMDACFAAIAAWHWRADKRAAGEAVVAATPDAVRAEAARRIDAASGRTLTEREAKDVLALYGVPVVGERLVQSEDDAVAAATGLGLPVVLKVESPDLPHKTEAGVIRLDLRTAEAVREGYRAVMANARKVSPPPAINGVLVQPMVPQGVEMVVGANVDPLFGPLIVVGLGGILVEVLQDSALAPAPVTPAEAAAMLRSLKGAKLLEGFRGMPAVDIPRLAQVIADVSRFAADHRDRIAELDVNPLICAGERITAVDALIVPRRAG
ncbi:MAG: CoA-binding protein [Rhodospirillales bacterium 69-11]|nr:acetate--CoA ligase family protein [Rhodospirillales bacterium]OJW24892.1 MAG: CoA-binding protein [Rhodospirillales bacterium 69-11]